MAGFDGPIFVDVGRSRLLTHTVVVVHVVLCMLVVLLLPGLTVKLLAFSALAAHGIWRLTAGSRPRADDLVAILLKSNDALEVRYRDGRQLAATLIRSPLVHPRLTALSLRLADSSRREIALLPDNVAAEPFRRLRVRLALRRASAAAD